MSSLVEELRKVINNADISNPYWRIILSKDVLDIVSKPTGLIEKEQK